MSPRRTPLQVAQDKHERAKLEYGTLRLQKGLQVLQKWDATEVSTMRRQPTVERKGEGGIYDMTRRLKGVSLGRDLERNYSPPKSMLHQFRVNVVGSQGKLKINTDDGDDAAAFFNEVWSKDCDYRDDCDWSTMLQNILGSEIREGDMLAVFDDGIVANSGKLLTWEADQIAPVTEEILNAKGYKGFKQDNGLIRDDWARVVAYCVTGKHGMRIIDDPKDVTIIRRDNARLVKNPWRLNQGRGTPSLLTASTNFIDLYEILACELASSKKAATQYAFVKRDDAVTDFDNPGTAPEFLPENDSRTAEEVAADGANQETHTARNYEQLESLAGGLVDYLDQNDTVVFPKDVRPNTKLAPFIEAVLGYSGASMGLARAYTMLRADTSYTAFRGDMIMTWVTFMWLQKHLERRICDWTAIRVLKWGIRKKLFKQLKDGWERKLSWSWPKMPEVDELDYENAIAQALKNGTTDYSELLGPDWEKKMNAYSDQLKVIRKLELPLGIFEMKSGGAANAKKDGAVPVTN